MNQIPCKVKLKTKTKKMEKICNILGANYIVSDDGKIYSTKRVGKDGKNKEIIQRLNQDGYCVVTVGNNQNRTSVRVHRIISTAFIPNPYNLPEVDHIDNNKTNNNVNNLRWITGYENKSRIPFEIRSISHRGEKNGRSILSKTDVKNIRMLYNDGLTQMEIANLYGRGWSTIHNIITRQTWKEE